MGDKKILGYKIKILAMKLTKKLAIKKILGTKILGDKKNFLGIKLRLDIGDKADKNIGDKKKILGTKILGDKKSLGDKSSGG